MPYYLCCSCHHEFEYVPKNNEYVLCNWCGAPTKILEDKTPLEKMLNDETDHFKKYISKDWIDKHKDKL